MTAETTSSTAMGDTAAEQLRAGPASAWSARFAVWRGFVGTRGVLVQMAQRGQIIELRCEMPKCYCYKGRGYFEPRSTPLTDWAPSPDHYPRLKADGGHLVPWNVRLSHVLCNRQDYGWRMRIRRMLEEGMSLDQIAENLNRQRVRRPHGSSKWSAAAVRKPSSPKRVDTSSGPRYRPGAGSRSTQRVPCRRAGPRSERSARR